MNFSKINQSRVSKLEKETLSKIKGGQNPSHPCYDGCFYSSGGSRWIGVASAAVALD